MNIAIIFVLSLLGSNPIFGFLTQIFMPIIIAILYLRTNIKTTSISVIASGFLTAILINPIMAFNNVFMFGGLGIVLGWCLKNNKKATTTISFLCITNTIESIFQIFAYFKFFTYANISSFFETILNDFKSSAKLFDAVGTNSEFIKLIDGLTINTLISMFPLAIMVNSLIVSFIIFYFITLIVKKLGYKVNKIPEFSQWYLDNRIAAIIIVVNCIVIFMKVNKIQLGDIMYYTVYTTINVIFSIQGLSVVVYFLKNKFKLDKMFIILISIMLCFGPLNIYLFILGIIDLLVDIRCVDPNSLGVFVRKKLKLSNK